MGTYVDRPIIFSLMECQIPIRSEQNLYVYKKECLSVKRISIVLHMFTAGADVLGCYESDRLWFLLIW